MSKTINNNQLKLIDKNLTATNQVENKALKSKQKQPYELFIKFIFKNLFCSISNIFLFLIIPIIIFALSIYLYSFFDSFSVMILLPSTFIGLFIFPRAMYRFHKQWLIVKRFSNYAAIVAWYFLFAFIWHFVVLALYVLIGAGFWNKGLVISQVTLEQSPTLIDYLSHTNWGSLIYTFFQNTATLISIGLFISFAFHKRTSQWVFILVTFFFLLGFALMVIPGIFPKLPLAVQYLTYLSPFTPSFNNAYISFNSYNIFDINENFKTLIVFESFNEATQYFRNTNFNVLNLFINLTLWVFSWCFLYIYYLWNNNHYRNYNPKNKLFIEIHDLKRTSSFKTLFLGVPESFKLDGMDSPYKNYIFNITHNKWKKFVSDILTNKIVTFKKNVIQFNDVDVLDEIQVLYFNQAPFSGLKVKDILNYYKRTDLIRYQSIISKFDFSKMLDARIDFLDYDYLFYLYIFSMIFNGKKIFIIDNETLAKVSQRIVNVVEANKLNYWLINNIQYDEN